MPVPHPCIPPLALLLALAISGCVIGDIDPENRRCPCAEGWICDGARDLCVRDGIADAGAAGDAGDAGDSRVDAAAEMDAGPPPPTCETVPDPIFCEDFEGDDLARWGSIEPAAGGTIDRTAAAARSGSQGLRIVAPPSSVAARMTAPIDTGVATDLYFRAWVRVASASSGPLDLFDLAVSGAGSVSAQMLPATESYVVRVADAGTPGVSDRSRDRRWSVGAWSCVAVHVARSQTAGSVTVLGGGGPNTAMLEGVDTEWGAAFDSFTIAVSSEGAEVELDDVMWTRAPVPCP